MNRDLFVSVIIPSYNREKTIVRAVNSVLNQSYKNLEVIVVDDCSSDNTASVLRVIADSRFRYIKLEKNSGACVARNTGVRLAKGNYIAFQDSDDYWHKDKIEKQLQYMKENNLDFCSCAFTRITKKTNIIVSGINIPNTNEDIWCSLLNYNWVSTQTIVCKKECFEKIGFDRAIKRYQDWDFALQAANFFNIGHITDSLVDVYLQSDSITNTVHNDEAMLKVIKKHEKDVCTNKMYAQYLKSMADVLRNSDTKRAAHFYIKSFIKRPAIKKLLCYLMCRTGIIRFYHNRN